MDIKPRVGIDIGGVIIEASVRTDDTSFFGKEFLKTPQVSKSFDSIKKIVDSVGPANVFLVSKAGEDTTQKTWTWLYKHNFFTHTGVYEDNIFFCKTRKEKAPICEQHNINIFIDDTFEIITILESNPKMARLFWLTSEELRKDMPGKCTLCHGWPEIVTELLSILTKDLSKL